MIILSERMKSLRKEKKILQREVAELLGVKLRTYQFYEGAGRQPDLEALWKLADFYDVSIDYLLGRTDER